MYLWAWYLLSVAGVIGGLLFALVVSLFLVSSVRTHRFKCCRGVQDKEVPHTEPVELWHAGSASMESQVVLCCLAEKGVEVKEHCIDAGYFGRFDVVEDSYMRVNPNGGVGGVCALVHEGHPVLTTPDIIAYIDQAFKGTRLLPPSKEDREEAAKWAHISGVAQHRQAEAKARKLWCVGQPLSILSMPLARLELKSGTIRACIRLVWRHPCPFPDAFTKLIVSIYSLLYCGRMEPTMSLAKPALAAVEKFLKELEEQLADGRPFLVGKHFSIADVCTSAVLHRLEVLGLLRHLIGGDKFPKAMQHFARVKERESFKHSFGSEGRPGDKEVDMACSRFRKELDSRGLTSALKLDAEEEEED